MFQRPICDTALTGLLAVLLTHVTYPLYGQTKAGGTPAAAKAPKARPPKKTNRPTGGARPAAKDANAGLEAAPAEEGEDKERPVHKTDREWKRLLTPKQYRVTRHKETELPFSGSYVHTKKTGVYRCVCCGAELFKSDTKFDSGTGWPSFYAPLGKKSIGTAPDYSDGTFRVEVTCARCAAHLGHVFNDGPEPTGLRYCINSAALKLKESSATRSTEKPPRSRNGKRAR